MSKVIKISLEDQGQDFSEWYVRDGVVIDCQPFQGQVWVGSQVKMDGDRISVKPRFDDTFKSLAYRIEGLETLNAEDAAKVEGYGRKWAEIIGVTAESLGLATSEA